MPATLVIRSGTTVAVTNRDSTTHTWTATGGAFDSGLLAPNASYSFTFNTPGTYTYVCSVHPDMTGTVTVTT